MFALAVMGIFAYGQLGQAEDPRFTFKVMVIRTLWPGATAQQVEQQVTERIEKKLQEMPELERLVSYSRSGESTVMFFTRESIRSRYMPEVFYQVRKKIGDLRYSLPAGIQGPFFNDEFGDVFGNIYALTAEGLSDAQLKDQAERLRDELRRVGDVGKVEIFGIQDEKIFVELSNTKLASLGIDLTAITQALAEQNAVADAGFFELADERIQLRPDGAFRSEESVANTLIRANGRSFRLGDIAQIRRGTSDPPAPRIRYNNQPGLAIGVVMAPGGDVITLGKALAQRLEELRRTLPVGVEINEAVSQPAAVKRSIDAFVMALAEAVSVVLLVTFISLGLRTGLVVAISIPLVLAATFLAMHILDVGLHKVSLGALILALGLLVDDAIIAVEMMWVKMEQGWERTRAAAFAYTSTAGPMLSGTLVTVAGFIPIALAQSAVGEYAFAFFQINAIALMLSWLAAVIAIPWLGYKLLPNPQLVREPGRLAKRWPVLGRLGQKLGVYGSMSKAGHEAGHDANHDVYTTPFYQRFRALLTACLRRRGWVIAGTLALFALAIAGMGQVPKQFFPNSTRLELNVELRLPEGASLPASTAAVKTLEDWLENDRRQHADFSHYIAWIGSGVPRYFLALDQQLPASNVSQFVIVTHSVEAREALRGRLIDFYKNDPSGVRANIARIENGPPVGYPVQFRVSGEDIATLRGIADELAGLLRQEPQLSNVNFDWHDLAKSIAIEIDQDKARLLGVSSHDVARLLSMSLQGYTVSSLREGRKQVDIVLRSSDETRLDPAALASLMLPTSSGKRVALGQIARLEPGFEPALIWRRDRLPTITVRANLYDDSLPATLVSRLQPAVSALQSRLPEGYEISTGGTVEESGKGAGSVMAGIPLFILAVITILMIQLQSVARVIMVLLTAPLGIIGIVLFLLIFRQPFGFMALLGTIALFGMIMRNSVILVDQIEQDINSGHTRSEAIIEATVRRLRPIVLTAAAAVLAMIPLSRNDFFGPMAIAIMGGLIVATVLTLFFLPALYAAWHKVSRPAPESAAH